MHFELHQQLNLMLIDSYRYEQQLTAQRNLPPTLVSRLEKIESKSRRLELLAVHYIIQLKLGANAETLYRFDGSPYLSNSAIEISISHSHGLVAVIFSESSRVGMDLEHRTPRIIKLIQKFAGPQEIENAPAEAKEDYYLILWTMKESLVKLFGKRNLDFRTEILVEPFKVAEKGETSARVILGDMTHNCELHYIQMERHVLSYALKVS